MRTRIARFNMQLNETISIHLNIWKTIGMRFIALGKNKKNQGFVKY